MAVKPSSPFVIFTIIAKNYLAAARTLMDSVAKHCPEAVRVVVFVDQVEDCFDPAKEKFQLIGSHSLDIPNIHWFHFKYTILELSTAIKPYAFQHLFQQYGAERVIYFDPDIKLYSGLDHLFGLLNEGNMVLTPHLTDTIRDQKHPGELEILRSGVYNLGFIAVRRSGESFRFLRWWREKLYDQCVVDLNKGLFVDQKWMDLAPGLFDGVVITRRARYNVAYWNIQHRLLASDNGRVLVNGEPLCFFHFSGYDPRKPNVFSKHQDRYAMSDLGLAREIVEDYGRELMSNGHAESSKWRYTYSYFENGTLIPDSCRPVHHESTTILDAVSNPFSDEGLAAFVSVWNARIRPDRAITKLAYRVYHMRSDVAMVMPDVLGSDHNRFLEWMTTSGREEHLLAEVFLAPIEAALDEARLAANAELESSREAEPALEYASDPIGVMELIRRIHKARKDLQRVFPNPEGEDELALTGWALSHGTYEYAFSRDERAILREVWEERVAALPASQRAMLRAKLEMSRFLLRTRHKAKRLLASPEAAKRQPMRPRPPAIAAGSGVDGLAVNLVGYAAAATGVGQSVRAAESAFKTSGFSPHIVRVELDGRWDPAQLRPNAASVFYINADQSELVVGAMNGSHSSTVPRIGYWAWELETFSDQWLPAFELFHEIWTPSSFCSRAMGKVTKKSVVPVPHPIQLDKVSRLGKTDFGLPADEFVFLCAFDMLSVFERKNPLAAVAAFRRAFPSERGARLVVKVNNGVHNDAAMNRLREAIGPDRRITLMDTCLTRGDMYALLACCDCYVSLHRSEGFGLMIAEAMWLGKPVIVTGYSGNMDFTADSNSFLVGYDLKPVGPGCSPYDPNERWADPRVEEASAQMRLVLEQNKLREERAGEAQRYVQTNLSPARVGEIITERLRLAGVALTAR